MMPKRTLATLYRSFYSRTCRLLDDFLILPSCSIHELEARCGGRVLRHSRGFLVNRFFHLWGEYCRHATVVSALGGCKTIGGNLLNSAPMVRNISDILGVIGEASITGPGMRWGDPRWTTRKVNRIQPTNLQQIKLGISAPPYDDLRRIRNFVIHSNPHTHSEFDTVAIAYSLMGASVDDLLLHTLPGGGTVMESLIRQFQYAAIDVVR